MPLYDYISPPTGATVALWHLTETEPELAALLPEEERLRLTGEGLSSKRFCEQAATHWRVCEMERCPGRPGR